MRRGELFGGALLVILGALFFLKASGYLVGEVLGWFWPVVIVAAGVWVLLDAFGSRAAAATAAAGKTFSVALGSASEGVLTIDHGAGRLEVGSGAKPGDFISGSEAAGAEHSFRSEGGKLIVAIEAGPSFIPFLGPRGGVWQYRLNPEVPTAIVIKSGASRVDADLTELRVPHFSYEGGASQLNLTLPRRAENMLVEIAAGAAGIDVRVPQGVGIRLRSNSVGALNVDAARFPMREPGLYQSADYDSSMYHAEVSIDGGATSIRIH